MQSVPIHVYVLFGIISISSIVWFHLAVKSRPLLFIVIGWAVIQSAVGLSGFYQYIDAVPPRIMLFGILPMLLLMGLTLFTQRGRSLLAHVNLKSLTYFHTIRIPVEIVLSLLFHAGAMSIYATFEGTNFDIISGISAPFIAYFCFSSKDLSKNKLVLWNIVCLLLLLNVVITAIFAFPSPFQKLAFDQPNIAPLYFPFCLLPTLVVPLVLFSHLIALQKLFSQKSI